MVRTENMRLQRDLQRSQEVFTRVSQQYGSLQKGIRELLA